MCDWRGPTRNLPYRMQLRCLFKALAARSIGMILAQGARVPALKSRSSPLPMCRCVALGQHGRNEIRKIRTRNLLIWSQTRYRCATPPHANVALSDPPPVHCNFHVVSLLGGEAEWRTFAARTRAQAARMRASHPNLQDLRGSASGSAHQHPVASLVSRDEGNGTATKQTRQGKPRSPFSLTTMKVLDPSPLCMEALSVGYFNRNSIGATLALSIDLTPPTSQPSIYLRIPTYYSAATKVLTFLEATIPCA